MGGVNGDKDRMDLKIQGNTKRNRYKMDKAVISSVNGVESRMKT